MALIAGRAEPFHHRAKKGIKNATNAIGAGQVLAVDTALTPDGWKEATAALVKPFGVLINKAAAATDTVITVLIEGEVTVTAGAAIEPNTYVMPDSAVAGRVMAWNGTLETTKVGLYLGDKGGSVPEAAADGDVIRIIKEAD